MSRTRRSRSTRAPATAAGEATRALAVAVVVLASACAATTPEAPDSGLGGSGAGGASGFGGGAPLVLEPIPDAGYTPADVGGYKLGAEIQAANIQGTLHAESSTACNRVRGIVRDFRGALPVPGGALQPDGHPDFEVFQGVKPTTGLVAEDLDPVSRKPVYASACELGVTISPTCPYGQMTTSAANFAQWYRSIEGVNLTYYVYFQLDQIDPMNPGTSTFSSIAFFPVDGTGWGNSGPGADGKQRNFSFTTEIHTTFKYNGGEIFQFTGDDDVWIFINGKLAVDLGGLHMSQVGMVDLDAQAATLGIQQGMTYPLDLFNAERHSTNSDFAFQMNFNFEDCGYIIP
jgi:fibro-slime domain-containing protein